MDAEKLLGKLFDFQRFQHEPTLKSIIDETEERYEGKELTDDDLGGISAAGDAYTGITDPLKRDKKP
ncbi:MAG: hypothetical protein J5590_06140 [Clostridia bacterium]|nr:hypothetical protein [Clostridia bacterium]